MEYSQSLRIPLVLSLMFLDRFNADCSFFRYSDVEAIVDLSPPVGPFFWPRFVPWFGFKIRLGNPFMLVFSFSLPSRRPFPASLSFS